MQTIGFSGRKQSGKTTAAEYVADRLSSGFGGIVQIVSFADTIKRIVAQTMYGQKLFHGSMKSEVAHGKTGREWLQIIGTDWFRHANPDCWVNALHAQITDLRGIAEMANLDCLVIVPDVRFPNEVKYLQESGPVIRLTRCPFPEDGHESEVALDGKTSNGQFILYKRYGNAGVVSDVKFELNTGGEVTFDHVIINDLMTIDEKNAVIDKILRDRGLICNPSDEA